MYNAVFFGATDVTAVILTAFTIFFFGLLLYLRREDRREGYPLEDEATGRMEGGGGLFFVAQPKTFRLPHGGGVVTKPNDDREGRESGAVARGAMRAGMPLDPQGDPMVSGMGPGAFVHRAHRVDPMADGAPKIVPLRAAPAFSVGHGALSANPIGMTVLGADRVPAGVVTEVWFDRSEYIARYFEVTLSAAAEGLGVVGTTPSAGRVVLLPAAMADVKKGRGVVLVDAITAAQFAGVPGIQHPDQITLYEEERVCAYYGAGYLYATPERAEPWL